jgi:hypothetical protein
VPADYPSFRLTIPPPSLGTVGSGRVLDDHADAPPNPDVRIVATPNSTLPCRFISWTSVAGLSTRSNAIPALGKLGHTVWVFGLAGALILPPAPPASSASTSCP